MLLCIAMITALCGMSAFAEDAAVAEVDGKQYASLEEAFEAVKEGGTVKLLNNVVTQAGISFGNDLFGGNIILDLNGHDITNEYVCFYLYGSYGTFTITGEGTITSTAYDAIRVEGGTMWDAMALNVEKYVKVVSNNASCIYADGKYTEVNVHGTLVSNGGNAAIQGYGNNISTDSKIVVYDEANISAKTTAIYHPQKGSLKILGGIITGNGNSAIEMRKGSLNISGNPIITSNAEAYTVKPNGSGATTVGAAVAVAPYSDSTIVVDISGGTFTGKKALSYANPNPATNFTATINVTGGTFSTDITEALTNAEVKSNIKDITVAANEDGTYGVEKRNEAFEKVAAVHKAGDKTLTFLAGINNLDYTKAGFRVTLNGQEQEIPTSTVYTALTVNGEAVDSMEKFGTKYFFAANIVINDENIAGFTIKPFATLINGDEVSAKEPTKVTLTGGAE